MKTDELMEQLQKKLEVPPEMCQEALQKLHKQGFFVVAGLKTMKKEAWERLALPLAIEEELKNTIAVRGTPITIATANCILTNDWILYIYILIDIAIFSD